MRNLLKWVMIFFMISAQAAVAPDPDSSFCMLADEYIDSYYLPTYPTNATQLGVHLYDSYMEDYTLSGETKNIATLKKYLEKFKTIKKQALTVQNQGNYDLVVNNINSQLLDIHPLKNNPDFYSSGISASAFVLMSRSFAPVNERLTSLIAREKLMPAILLEARHNLVNPPKIYTEIALEQLPGIIQFFSEALPAAFVDRANPVLWRQFMSTNAAVVQALRDYEVWLKNDLLARSNGDFRLGEKLLSEKLHYDEMVDMPLNDLLTWNRKDMHANQLLFIYLARLFDPDKSTAEVLAEMSVDQPAPDQLLLAFSDKFTSLIQFIEAKHIITIPSPVLPIMQESPPFLRATSFASMDTPGPFEKNAKEAYFNVTLPSANLSAEQLQEYMKFFNYSAISSTAIHEAYPGHYVQFLWIQTIPDRIRKIFGAMSNAEGWAHYCEQMMLEEGYGNVGFGAKSDREARLLRLGQLHNALLRNARFEVAIRLHTGQMTFDQAVKYFMTEGYQTKSTAMVETKRATMNPTYLYYTLGKLQILQLRADLQKKERANFNLRKFHDDFMAQGYPPIAIVRQALLN